jgi:hypothetical protein
MVLSFSIAWPESAARKRLVTGGDTLLDSTALASRSPAPSDHGDRPRSGEVAGRERIASR